MTADEAAEAMSEVDSLFSAIAVEVTPSPSRSGRVKKSQSVEDVIAIARTQREIPARAFGLPPRGASGLTGQGGGSGLPCGTSSVLLCTSRVCGLSDRGYPGLSCDSPKVA